MSSRAMPQLTMQIRKRKKEFYTCSILQTTMRNRNEMKMTLLMGDLIAKVGADNLGYQRIMGLHGKRVINENGNWRYNLPT